MNPSQRVADFNRRREHAKPADIFELNGFNSEYIPVHAAADESELLKQLGLKRTQCRSIDSYWLFGGDVAFVEVFAFGFIDREVGIYGRLTEGDCYYHHFQVVTNRDFLETSDVRNSLLRIIDLGFEGRRFSGAYLTNNLQRIDTED